MAVWGVAVVGGAGEGLKGPHPASGGVSLLALEGVHGTHIKFTARLCSSAHPPHPRNGSQGVCCLLFACWHPKEAVS